VAVNDNFTATLVSRYSGGTYNNVFHGQITNENNPLQSLSDFADLVQNEIVENLKLTVVESMVFDAIVVRRLVPAISDVFVKQISITGDLPQEGLPGTCFALLRYFCTPYEKGTAYHWKLNGLPDDANNCGLMTEQAFTRYTNLIESITQSPYVQGASTFNFTRYQRTSDVGGSALPRIYKAQLDNTIRNLRSRQTRL
jgi:hypothetical protein